MKIFIASSNDLREDIDLARMFEADIVLSDKSGGITVAYSLTNDSEVLMDTTKIRRHLSQELLISFYPIPFNMDSAKAFLSKKFAVEYVFDSEEQRLMNIHNCRKVRDGLYISRDVFVIGIARARALTSPPYYPALQPFVDHPEWAHEPHPEWRDNATFVFREIGSSPEMVGKPVVSKKVVRYTLDRWCRVDPDPEMIEMLLFSELLTQESEENYK